MKLAAKLSLTTSAIVLFTAGAATAKSSVPQMDPDWLSTLLKQRGSKAA